MENDRSFNHNERAVLPERKSEQKKRMFFCDSKSVEKFIYIVISEREVPKRRKSFTVQFPLRKICLSGNLNVNGGLFLCKTKARYSSFEGKNKTLTLG